MEKIKESGQKVYDKRKRQDQVFFEVVHQKILKNVSVDKYNQSFEETNRTSQEVSNYENSPGLQIYAKELTAELQIIENSFRDSKSTLQMSSKPEAIRNESFVQLVDEVLLNEDMNLMFTIVNKNI